MTGFAVKDKLIEPIEDASVDPLRTKKPPPGAVPLFAMGHNPRYDAPSSTGDSNYFMGPYGKLDCA